MVSGKKRNTFATALQALHRGPYYDLTMATRTSLHRAAWLTGLLAVAALFTFARAQVRSATTTKTTEVLDRSQASAILPATVFFRGQSASLQARNSAGLRTAEGKLVLVSLVDTSGYSSALQETYQAYLITEVALSIGSGKLAPGAYGFGFVADNKMVLMDLGGNELLRATTTHDQILRRPTPLQILPDGIAAHGYRLYMGRAFVTLAPVTLPPAEK